MGTSTPSIRWRTTPSVRDSPVKRTNRMRGWPIFGRHAVRSIAIHPYGGRHLERQLVVLQRRCQADDALGDEGYGFGKRMGGFDRRIGELIKPTRQARDRIRPNKTRQRLRSNASGHEILEAEHAPGFQEIEGAVPLSACRRQRHVTNPLHERLIAEVLTHLLRRRNLSRAGDLTDSHFRGRLIAARLLEF